MMLFRQAWRNIWRNKRRTYITLTAVTLNTAILIISYALMDGMLVRLVQNATNIVVGEAQIHAVGYREDHSFFKDIKDAQKIIQAAKNSGIDAAPRNYGHGLVSAGKKSAGALFWGVDPGLEEKTFDLSDYMEVGNFLSKTPDMGMVLGRKLANSLDAKVGSEIIVVVQAADGSLGNELFRVSGIIKSIGDSIDRGAAIIHQADFAELFVSGGRIHEIAFNSRGRLTQEELLAELGSYISSQVELKSWRQLLPTLSDMVNLFNSMIVIFGAVFFLAAGLGVMNTMLMATYERMREFGILKAIGSTPFRIVSNMAVEAFVLTLTAVALGSALGIVVTLYLAAVGIDTSSLAGGFSISGIAWDPIWRAELSLRVVLMPVVVMCVVCTLASLYPAAIAARMDPVKAIHHV